jgi:protein phosphatase
MLVCTHCGFENPNSNNFCQECGASLMHNTCPACGSLVPFNSLDCQDCGAEAGVVWLAIATLPAPDAPPQTYLDQEQRYQLLEPFVSSATPDLLAVASAVQPIQVLDCQPLQLSPLEALSEADLDQLMGSFSLDRPAPDPALEPSSTGSTTGSILAVPALAQPYLALRNQFLHIFPAIHDMWQTEGQAVVLLEERSHLRMLSEFWQDQAAPTSLAVVDYLTDFVELWAALTPWHCRQSLLELKNLRVDSDGCLCLQYLYADAADAAVKPAPTLVALGQVWQGLFPPTGLSEAVVAFVADVASGQMTHIDSVRSRLEAIAQVLMMPPPMNPVPVEPVADSAAVDPMPSVPTIPPAALALMMEDDEGEGDSDGLPTIVLPMQLFSIEDAGRSDTGQQREHNEDFYGIDVQLSKQEGPKGTTMAVRNLYILCDGMGGHAGGEVASMMAVNTLRQYFKDHWQTGPLGEGDSSLPDESIMIAAVQLANKVIYDENQKNASSGSGRMGTTLVLMLVQDTNVAIAHVGDSRLYRYTRKRGIEQITIDHEVGQREIQRGVDADIAYARPDAYQLTQALGPRDEDFIKPAVQYLDINEDSLFLLCSDGLSDNNLLETHWKSHIEPLLSSQTNLDSGVGSLLDLANEYNGHDNITAIAVRAKVRPNLAHLR